mmetsp:Transcript_30232/g.89696  ORF Transcript_30232/g.89696 Transcript_30232/m.89696 type:complete len:165 (+) Transcript_30232:492-986(+)
MIPQGSKGDLTPGRKSFATAGGWACRHAEPTRLLQRVRQVLFCRVLATLTTGSREGLRPDQAGSKGPDRQQAFLHVCPKEQATASARGSDSAVTRLCCFGERRTRTCTKPKGASADANQQCAGGRTRAQSVTACRRHRQSFAGQLWSRAGRSELAATARAATGL